MRGNRSLRRRSFKELDSLLTPQLVWTGKSAIVASAAYGGPKVVTVFSIDPVSGVATRLPDGLLTNRDDIIVAASDGAGRVTFVGRGMGVARLETRTDTWIALPSVPLKSYEGSPGLVTVRGEQIFIHYGIGDLAVWNGSRWTVMRAPFARGFAAADEYAFAVDFERQANRFLRWTRRRSRACTGGRWWSDPTSSACRNGSRSTMWPWNATTTATALRPRRRCRSPRRRATSPVRFGRSSPGCPKHRVRRGRPHVAWSR